MENLYPLSGLHVNVINSILEKDFIEQMVRAAKKDEKILRENPPKADKEIN